MSAGAYTRRPSSSRTWYGTALSHPGSVYWRRVTRPVTHSPTPTLHWTRWPTPKRSSPAAAAAAASAAAANASTSSARPARRASSS